MAESERERADAETAAWNLFMHERGSTLSCCAWADPCPIWAWAMSYRHARTPYPVALVLGYVRETNSHESR